MNIVILLEIWIGAFIALLGALIALCAMFWIGALIAAVGHDMLIDGQERYQRHIRRKRQFAALASA